jgi:hypothetical protein
MKRGRQAPVFFVWNEKVRLLFVNKKGAKNLANLGCAGFTGTGPVKRKIFAPLFSTSGRRPSFACPDRQNVVYQRKIKPDFCRVALNRPPFLLDFAHL